MTVHPDLPVAVAVVLDQLDGEVVEIRGREVLVVLPLTARTAPLDRLPQVDDVTTLTFVCGSRLDRVTLTQEVRR